MPVSLPLKPLLATLSLVFAGAWAYTKMSSQNNSNQMQNSERASKLKDEGNALFVKKDYVGASNKYTAAIAFDKSNAILYANRSACRLNLRRFMDAASDAEKATEFDPTYVKAYARLATAQDALGKPWLSVDSWQKAVDKLQLQKRSQSQSAESESSNAAALNPGLKQQKDQYEAALAAARKALDALTNPGPGLNHIVIPNGMKNLLPWNRARERIPELKKEGEWDTSSAWVIAHAHAEFEEGVRLMECATTQGGIMIFHNAAITCLSNAILTDSRAFYITDPNWVSKYNQQAIGEATMARAWFTGGPDIVKQEALQRLRVEGWDAVRIALSTTVRCWIMHGFLEGALRRNNQADVEYTKRAVEIIKWGRTEWAEVPKDDRGAIFEESFLRGVQGRYMEALMNLIKPSEGTMNTSLKETTLEDLLTESDEVLESVDRQAMPPRRGEESYFALAYWDYLKGEALAMQAFYYTQKAVEDIQCYGKAILLYIRAAQCYPVDDERYIWYSIIAFNNMMEFQAPVKLQLSVAERVRSSLPRMKRIWAQSDLVRHREYGIDVQVERLFQVEESLRELLNEGKVDMETCVGTSLDGSVPADGTVLVRK